MESEEIKKISLELALEFTRTLITNDKWLNDYDLGKPSDIVKIAKVFEDYISQG